ncbi:hypothetical protein N8E89_25445 (plasmid) [Phyllobacterium sp. A18/5-2]|uniref:hypothetical protein n=1 Tax=Phyllobacterium sp. A18/5-2 TaxID=2978392 RepID=UPI0021C94134|nr:hypothetical protein [Phyllobacterium sp. A18/5-2]UXN66462.1 hypothetical protein N8E89_25445 [Phyllobacterium sp. A18/5-2]
MRATTASLRNPANTHEMSGATIAILLFVAFVALGLLSWPILFSMELWIFRDRSSLLNLDYLIDKGYLIGVDIGYAYGLLPLLLQRVAFAVFGRGYWPMIGFIVATWGLMAIFWACVIREVGGTKVWLLVVVALAPLTIIVNPNFPYSLLQLSTLYSLLLVLYGKRNLALAIAVAGCFAIPSLSLVLSALLVSMILLDLHQRGQFTLRNVLAAFAPALVVGLLLLTCMLFVFGISSILAAAPALPGHADLPRTAVGVHVVIFRVSLAIGQRAGLHLEILCHKPRVMVAVLHRPIIGIGRSSRASILSHENCTLAGGAAPVRCAAYRLRFVCLWSS